MIPKPVYVTGFAKRDLIHAYNFSTLKVCSLAYVSTIALKFLTSLFLHGSYLEEIFSLISHSQIKLCLYKVTKLDACIRPLYTNPVTYLSVCNRCKYLLMVHLLNDVLLYLLYSKIF